MKVDIAVIGAGIAGASLAAELAPHAAVALIEAEDTPGYHATGRSAAFWHETLGGPLVRPLTIASRPDLEAGGFLKPRYSLEVATAETLPLLDELAAQFDGTDIRLDRVDGDGVRALVPRAKDTLIAGLVERDCADIDVGGLHGLCLGRFKRAGGALVTSMRIEAIEPGWRLTGGGRTVEAEIVVNAAGAWADELAAMAGARRLGISPKRRTIAQVRVDGDDVPPDLPLVMDIAGEYYFRPERADCVWVCPHDETPVDPHDAAPEELDVAIAIDRFETFTDWKVLAVERKWAGLRSFAPDRLPVYGLAPEAPGFFWCAGQGGYGIQTAPAAAKLAAALVLGREPDASVALINPATFAPTRFA